jgi:hypothetical protein
MVKEETKRKKREKASVRLWNKQTKGETERSKRGKRRNNEQINVKVAKLGGKNGIRSFYHLSFIINYSILLLVVVDPFSQHDGQDPIDIDKQHFVVVNS